MWKRGSGAKERWEDDKRKRDDGEKWGERDKC